jgi:cyanophycin synthetase
MGYKVGFTTSDGIYIQNRMLQKGDCTGPVSAEFVLRDPTVNFAVLETARGGILRAGLGFGNCDIAIVTNVAADHLGMKGINTLEELARVKSIVAESVLPGGYAILNADDDLVYEMRKTVSCQVAYFSMDENNPRIVDHCKQGGLAAVYENGYVTIMKGDWKLRVDKVTNIPITFRGKAKFNIQNTLPTLLAGFIRGFRIADMKMALETFIPSPAQTPGRMNMFRFKEFDVMLDYAHNAAGFQAVAEFLAEVEASEKVGIIAGVGDRRDEDILALGTLSAKMFDKIIIRQDKNLRGRTEDELIDLMMQGVKAEDPNKDVRIIQKESDAIRFAISNAKKDSFIVICSDVIPEALDLVRKLNEEEDHIRVRGGGI